MNRNVPDRHISERMVTMPADHSQTLLDFLLEAVAQEGAAPVPAQVLARLITSAAAAQARLQRLTPSERVVLARAASGDTNAVIAQALFISPGTVRKHLEHIYDKLEVRNRTEAAAIYTTGLNQMASEIQACGHDT